MVQGALPDILRSHWLDYNLLAENQFQACFTERGLEMLKLISRAMDKEIPGGKEVFHNALVKAGLRSADASDAASPEVQEFEDPVDEYDEIGSALYENVAAGENEIPST